MPRCESLRRQIIGMGNWITCITGRIGGVDRMLCESGVRLRLLLFYRLEAVAMWLREGGKIGREEDRGKKGEG